MIFPLVVMTLITYHKQNEIFRSQFSQLIQQSVEQIKNTVDTNLNEIDRLTWSLLYQQTLDFTGGHFDTTYQLNEANRLFREKVYSDLFSGRLNHIRSVIFVTSDYHVLSTDNSLQSFEQLEQSNFKYIIGQFDEKPLNMLWFNNERAIYQSKSGFETPVQASVTAARKLVDSNTTALRGYLFIQLNDFFLDEYLGKVQIGSSGSFQITDTFGNVIYGRSQELFDNEKITSAIQQLPIHGSGTQIVDGKWLLAYDNSEVTNWKLTSAVSLNELHRPYQGILKLMLLMAGMGAIISIIISILFTNVISKPVIGLAKSMTNASFNLRSRENMSVIREISVLQRNFNQLLERIQQLLIDNESEQKRRGEAQLKSLQMQIQPHFLYNTLDTIYWMSKKHHAEPISKLITALGKFFRFTLSSGLDRVTMQRELEHVNNYLQVQAFRYRDKLEYEIRCEPKLQHIMIMPLILQPLVENAIEHGIAKLKNGGRVEISVYESGSVVFVDIENDGNDFDVDAARQLLLDASPSDHIGLRNVQQRIKISHGEEFGIRMIDRVNDRTLIRLSIPFTVEV